MRWTVRACDGFEVEVEADGALAAAERAVSDHCPKSLGAIIECIPQGGALDDAVYVSSATVCARLGLLGDAKNATHSEMTTASAQNAETVKPKQDLA